MPGILRVYFHSLSVTLFIIIIVIIMKNFSISIFCFPNSEEVTCGPTKLLNWTSSLSHTLAFSVFLILLVNSSDTELDSNTTLLNVLLNLLYCCEGGNLFSAFRKFTQKEQNVYCSCWVLEEIVNISCRSSGNDIVECYGTISKFDTKFEWCIKHSGTSGM